jgi:hypothetical protein
VQNQLDTESAIWFCDTQIWNATCSIQCVRISLKPAATHSAASIASSAKESKLSFLSLLSAASSKTVNLGEVRSMNSQSNPSKAAAVREQSKTQTNEKEASGQATLKTDTAGEQGIKLAPTRQTATGPVAHHVSAVVNSSDSAKPVSSLQKPNRSGVGSRSSKHNDSEESTQSAGVINSDLSQQPPVRAPQDCSEAATATPQAASVKEQNDGEVTVANLIADSSANGRQEMAAQSGFESGVGLLSLSDLTGTDETDPLQGAFELQSIGVAENSNATGGIASPAIAEAEPSANAGAASLKDGKLKDLIGKTRLKAGSGVPFSSDTSSKDSDISETKDNARRDATNAHVAQIVEQSSQHLAGNSLASSGGGQTGEQTATQNMSFVAATANTVSSTTAEPVNRNIDTTAAGQPAEYPVPDEIGTSGFTTTNGLNTARLIQSMSETEMRVGLHSHDFGDISIRTSVSQQRMQAQISVDHDELGKAISSQLPTVQSKLSEDFGLRATIEVNQSTAFQTGREGGSSQQDAGGASRSFSSSRITAMAGSDAVGELHLPLVVDDGRLDIRA